MRCIVGEESEKSLFFAASCSVWVAAILQHFLDFLLVRRTRVFVLDEGRTAI